jgi:Mitochondrial carrier protein
MQSIEARKSYKNSFVCAAKIVKDEGFFTLWSGALPRLGRLILSGGIVFTMFVDPAYLVSCQAIWILTTILKSKVRENDGNIGYVRPRTEIPLNNKQYQSLQFDVLNVRYQLVFTRDKMYCTSVIQKKIIYLSSGMFD